MLKYLLRRLFGRLAKIFGKQLFVFEFIFKSIFKNYTRSVVIVFSFVLLLSGTVAMLGWLETSPEIVVDRVFESRGYEMHEIVKCLQRATYLRY